MQSVLIQEFNKKTRSLIDLLELKSKTEVDHNRVTDVRRRINILISTMGSHILIKMAAPIFIKYSDKIIARDVKFFNTVDICNEGIPEVDEFAISLLDHVRVVYNTATLAEKDVLYSKVLSMLEDCVKYQLQ
jgi:hypothetical protein